MSLVGMKNPKTQSGCIQILRELRLTKRH